MTYIQFREIVLSLPDCQNLDEFITERGWQDWMDEYATEEDNADRVVEILTVIWGMRENPIKGIKAAAGLTNAKLSEQYGISIRTIEDWARGARSCPDYTSTMLAYCVFSDHGII